MKEIDAGALNRRVVIQKYEPALDEHGYAVPDGWKDFLTVWAHVEPVSARQFWAAQAAHAELTHQVTIRFHCRVTADMRLKLGNRILDIVGPPLDYDDAHKYLVLRCREVTT